MKYSTPMCTRWGDLRQQSWPMDLAVIFTTIEDLVASWTGTQIRSDVTIWRVFWLLFNLAIKATLFFRFHPGKKIETINFQEVSSQFPSSSWPLVVVGQYNTRMSLRGLDWRVSKPLGMYTSRVQLVTSNKKNVKLAVAYTWTW